MIETITITGTSLGRGRKQTVRAQRGAEVLYHAVIDPHDLSSRKSFALSTMAAAFPGTPRDDWPSGMLEAIEQEVWDLASVPPGAASVGDTPGPVIDPIEEDCDYVGDDATNPHRLAARFLASGPRIRYWRGEYHRYCEGAYRAISDVEFKAEVVIWLRAEFKRLHEWAMGIWLAEMKKLQAQNGTTPAKKKPRPIVLPVTPKVTQSVIQATSMVLVAGKISPPYWLDGYPGPPASQLMAAKNGILDLAAAIEARPDHLLPPNPSFFTQTAVPYPYDPKAPVPTAWFDFLKALWPDDQESIDTLQEWFGYMLTPDTSQQKILFLHGPKRSGKGTIARVLRDLIGEENVAGPTLSSLASPFGLSPLLDKTAAIIADARISGRVDTNPIIENLLAISGEDAITVDRKHREPVTARLRVRFTILANVLPKLNDTSGALPGRFIILRFVNTWFGKEDHDLYDRLKGELPGILLWAMEGLARLRQRGKFIQPESSDDLVETAADIGSSVGQFVREKCVVGPGIEVKVDDLWAAWKRWCEENGKKEPGIKPHFGQDLHAAVPGLTKRRPRMKGEDKDEVGKGRVQIYYGIDLLSPVEAEERAERADRFWGPND